MFVSFMSLGARAGEDSGEEVRNFRAKSRECGKEENCHSGLQSLLSILGTEDWERRKRPLTLLYVRCAYKRA